LIQIKQEKSLRLIQIKTEFAIGEMDLIPKLRCNNSEPQIAALGHFRRSSERSINSGWPQ